MNSRRLPAEWEPQSGAQLVWPRTMPFWENCMDRVEGCFAAIAREIARRETLIMACRNGRVTADALAMHGVNMAAVRLFELEYDDAWSRDHGGITILEDGAPVILDFTFDGWGGKYASARDNALTERLHMAGAFGHTPLRPVPLTLEGGSIDVDGAGTMLTTSACLLHGHRNPHLDKTGVESAIQESLGVDRVLWLEHGYLAGDDTDSHVDVLARFCARDAITYVRCDDAGDEHYEALSAMERELQSFRTRGGEPYVLHPLPWPDACYDGDGQRVPASYANFLVINGAVLAPVYGVKQDEDALRALEGAFPGREIVPLDCSSLILEHGSLHCVTMQFPLGVEL
ncbi:MAG: hypothetical protein AMXMBFR84_09990 [Candidatus Hydrogenedentota bacterium]